MPAAARDGIPAVWIPAPAFAGVTFLRGNDAEELGSFEIVSKSHLI